MAIIILIPISHKIREASYIHQCVQNHYAYNDCVAGAKVWTDLELGHGI